MTDNELIAKFMGGSFEKRDFITIGGKRTGKWTFPDRTWCYDDQLQYNERFDWLMPVVEKIENISYIGVDKIYFNIIDTKAQIWTYFDVKEFLRLTGDDKNERNKFKVGISAKTKMEAVYAAVVEFIKWYNTQNSGSVQNKLGEVS